MNEETPVSICCTNCSTMLARSLSGTKTYLHCPKCKIELFYVVGDTSVTIETVKRPVHRAAEMSKKS